MVSILIQMGNSGLKFHTYENASRPVSRVLSMRKLPSALDDHSSGTPVAGRFTQPTRMTGPETALNARRHSRHPYSVLLPVGFAWTAPVAGSAVRSYRTFSPLRQARMSPYPRFVSVALSLGSPPPGVTRHRVPMEPGLSSPAPFRALRQRSSSQLAKRQVGAGSSRVKSCKTAIGLEPLYRN